MATDGWEKYKDCEDPSWAESSEPFLILFADKRPFAWKEIFAWGRDHDIHKYWCRQIIAFMELKSLIRASCNPVLWSKCGNWTVAQGRKALRTNAKEKTRTKKLAGMAEW